MAAHFVGGEALKEMLSQIDVDKKMEQLKQDIASTKSKSKRDAYIKQLKYVAGLKKQGFQTAADAYVIHNAPILPPSFRPFTVKGANQVEYSDINKLYKDHMLVNNALADVKHDLPPDMLVQEREQAYNGLKAIVGLGDPITADSKGQGLKGLIRQVAGVGSPKLGFMHSKVLFKKQDFSGRATIYADPSLGFNEAGIPKDMIWTMYKLHIVKDLARNGFTYLDAEKAWADRTPAAIASMNKVIKDVPIILNRAPTLMKSNITAFMPRPVEGKTIGFSPVLLPMLAGDFDGDAVSTFVPMTPEAVKEAKEKLLPMHQIYDYRRGVGSIMVAPGHEAILGSMHLTEPDHKQDVVEFNSEADVLRALKAGKIKENTPVRIKKKTS